MAGLKSINELAGVEVLADIADSGCVVKVEMNFPERSRRQRLQSMVNPRRANRLFG